MAKWPFSETIQVPVCPSMEKGQQGYVENMSQTDIEANLSLKRKL